MVWVLAVRGKGVDGVGGGDEDLEFLLALLAEASILRLSRQGVPVCLCVGCLCACMQCTTRAGQSRVMMER